MSLEILYISSACASPDFDLIFEKSSIKPGQAVQKFHRLLIEGFSYNKESCSIQALSCLPVTPKSSKKIFWNIKDCQFNGVKYNYIPTINIQGLKHLIIFISTFFKIIKWNSKNELKNKIIVCDILNVTVAWASIFASKIIGIKILVIVTDLPSFTMKNSEFNFGNKLYLYINKYFLSKIDLFIGLTLAMNKIINIKNRPFMVMEGLVDIDINKRNKCKTAYNKKILLYAGGVYDMYGIKNLVKSFMLIQSQDVELHIYGSGDFVDELISFCNIDKRIIYFGVLNNSQIVEKLEEATLLLNPRPIHEFTKYSFPSKIMEYMASGTPTVTTNLSGIPDEYLDYLYLFDNCSIEGLKNTLEKILIKPNIELLDFGKRAKEFVLNNKSNIMQARNVLNFLNLNQ